MIRIGLIFPLFSLATLILLIPGYVSTSELEQESIIYEEIYGRISIIDDVFHEDKTIIIGLKINLKEGWKTYWRHSGTTGLPTVINIEKIPDMEDFEIFWPKPEVQESDGDISLIYENEILIPIAIKLNNKNLPYLLKLNADFGVCKNICIPVKKDLNFFSSQFLTSSRLQIIFFSEKKIPNIPHTWLTHKSTPFFLARYSSPRDNLAVLNSSFLWKSFWLTNSIVAKPLAIASGFPDRVPA